MPLSRDGLGKKAEADVEVAIEVESEVELEVGNLGCTAVGVVGLAAWRIAARVAAVEHKSQLAEEIAVVVVRKQYTRVGAGELVEAAVAVVVETAVGRSVALVLLPWVDIQLGRKLLQL
jgi:hypothetical protein